MTAYVQNNADVRRSGVCVLDRALVMPMHNNTAVELAMKFRTLSVGTKFIPLRTPGGELVPGSGLFVQIKKTATPGSTELEARNIEAVESVPSKSQVRRISRQEAIDIERGTIRDVAKVEEGNKAESGEREEPTASYERRFTSPASLESSPGDPFKEYDASSKLTVVVEVHENTAL